MPYWYQTPLETYPDMEDYYGGFGNEAAGRFNDLSDRMMAIANGVGEDYDALIGAYQQSFQAANERLIAGNARAESEYRTGREATLTSIDRSTGAAAGRVAGSLASRGMGGSSFSDAAVNEVHREGELDKGRVREQYGAGLADIIMRSAATEAQFADSGNRFIAGARMQRSGARLGAMGAALDLRGQGIGAWMGAKSAWLSRRYADPMMFRKPRPFWHGFASMGMSMGGAALGSYLSGGSPAGGQVGGMLGGMGAQGAGFSGGEG